MVGLSLVIIFRPVSYADEVKTFFVGSNLIDCVGVNSQKCMHVRICLNMQGRCEDICQQVHDKFKTHLSKTSGGVS